MTTGMLPRDIALERLASEALPPVPTITLTSQGVVLILGEDARAIEAGQVLAGALDVTVMLDPAADVAVPQGLPFPVARGRATSAKGHFGAYEVTLDGFRAPLERGGFGPARDGALSRCDLIFDLRSAPPLFPAHEARDGYLRPDAEGLAAALEEAADLVGEFDKPRYIAFKPDICAHSRSQITGCTRCLDVCAMEAISPAGDHVEIDAYVCAGCGNCAAVCPTGAASYTLPPVDALLGRVRTLLMTYREAGGRDAVVLFHEGYHGGKLVAASDLPANVLAFEVNEVKQLGPEALAAALAYGASAARVLVRQQPKNGVVALSGTIATTATLAAALGYGTEAVDLLRADTPDELMLALGALVPGIASPAPSTFTPSGDKRGLLELTLKMLHRVAPAPVDVVPLPKGAPFGTLNINVEGCTLCLSCVSACPTGALSAGEDRPSLRFAESACVQCGLCAATCPEKVIELEPRIDFAAWNAPRRVIKEEEPFCCIRCSKPFGTKSTIERIIAKLESKHWMYSGENARRLDAIRMCEQCRVEAVLNEGIDPYAGAERPRPRTAEDYLAAERGEK